MRKFRIVADLFAGYEVQVKYVLFPFKWFQLNDYNGVNTSATLAEAIELMNQYKSGKRHKSQRTPDTAGYQLTFKSFLKTGICNTSNIIWQERFMEYLLQKRAAREINRHDNVENISDELAILSAFKNKKVSVIHF